MYRKAHALLVAAEITIERAFIGEFATSLEMAGASISIIRVDDEMLNLINNPAHTPFYTQV
jgi:dihydroxyacetone kinase